jgi:hypothetical protein
MTLVEAAKQALWALELDAYGEPPRPERNAAITTLRTAIEQAEKQEPVAWDVFELRLYGAPQEKQHRVLWVDRYTHPDGSTPDLDGLLEAAKKAGGIDGGAKTLHVRPLYTTPPAAQWVGLTDEEAMQTWEGIIKYAPGEVRLKDFARAIEAKLKEKNGV